MDYRLKTKNMCLAIPGKIQSIESMYDGLVRMAKVSFGGIIKQASLEMVPDAQVGDYVLVHVGVAITKVDEEEAAKTFAYLKEIGEIDELIEHTQVERFDN
jgi:hydrogenase expression/formation protein HypC